MVAPHRRQRREVRWARFEDVTSETVDAAHIRRRVDDWSERVMGLFAAIGEWLPDGWEARRGRPVVMHER